MNSLFDVLLERPLTEMWIQFLLFASFTLHIIFVLLMIGTAILAMYYFIETGWGHPRRGLLPWDKRILRTFMAHKSLAVVLGVGPLLILQMAYSVPFLTAANLHAAYWMLVIAMLIVAFLSFDALGHKIYVHRYLHLFFGAIALIFLLSVPGVFVAVLVTLEEPKNWVNEIRHGSRLLGPVGWHWLTRYLHVIGAAVVFGAAFHYFFTTEHEDWKRKKLVRWIIGGVLFQVAVGVLLYGSLPRRWEIVTNATLTIGIIGAMILLWVVFSHQIRNVPLKGGQALILLMLVLIPMLLTRQLVQNRALLPLTRKLQANASAYAAKLEPHKKAVLVEYRQELSNPVNSGRRIYQRSCRFCHGRRGGGQGKAATGLEIPPEHIRAVRAVRGYVDKILIKGIPGTGMPGFGYYDRDQIDRLLDYLNSDFTMFSSPSPVPETISDRTLQRAKDRWKNLCSQCHGTDGRPTELSASFRPPPPDFRSYGLLPHRAFHVISNGYPQTLMVPFGKLPEDVRWALVKLVSEKLTTGAVTEKSR